MKALITGSDGFLGTAVIRHLDDLGIPMVRITRRPGGRAGWLTGDLGDPMAVCRVLDEAEADCVVSLAAAVDFSPGVLPALYPVNTLCPALIAAWCATHGAHFVHASSIAVHGRLPVCVGPSTAVNPDTDYGRSKWLAEELIAASGCVSAVIRIGGIFGRGGPAHLGLNRALADAQSGTPPTIVGTGAAKRSYVHVDDVAAKIAICLVARLQGVFYAGGETRTIREMLQTVCDVWLPGEVPLEQAGSESADQIVESSPELGPVRSFRAGLEACR